MKVVFFGRFVAVLRTFAAFFAGMTKMRWPVFLAANMTGGLLWASLYTFGAYALGNAAHSAGSYITYVGYGVASAVTVASVAVARKSMRRLQGRAEEALPEASADGSAAPEPASGLCIAASGNTMVPGRVRGT